MLAVWVTSIPSLLIVSIIVFEVSSAIPSALTVATLFIVFSYFPLPSALTLEVISIVFSLCAVTSPKFIVNTLVFVLKSIPFVVVSYSFFSVLNFLISAFS